MNNISNIIHSLFLFTMLISTPLLVFGQATIPIYITLEDNSITATMLDDMGANTGQILAFSADQWRPDDLEGLTYSGAWNAYSNSPDLSGGGTPGEYYIVSFGGTSDPAGGSDSITWLAGDWVVWNDVENQWEQFINTSEALSFSGRTGDVTPAIGDYAWADIDKTISSISEIADIDSTGKISNKVLKWYSTGWGMGNDMNTGTITPTANVPLLISADSIPDISIAKADSMTDGYLSSTDWNTFNNKQNTIIIGTATEYIKGNNTLGTFSDDVLATQITGFTSMAGTITNTDTILQAIKKLDGNIESKEPIINPANLTETNSNVLSITNGSNSIFGSGTTIEVTPVDASNSGYLSSTDWNTFNNKIGSNNIDDITFEINGSDQLQIKDSGISSDKISFTSTIKSTDFLIPTTENNRIYLVSGNTTVTLPSAILAGSGFTVSIRKIDTGNKVMILPDGLETIDGKEVATLESEFAFIKMITDGSSWFFISQSGTLGWCPFGFIPVTEDKTLGTEEFCVMKYEAKDSSGTPASHASGAPWVQISAYNAQAECESMGEEGFNGTFTLISNVEWMAIARNIETTSKNWSGGSIGLGYLPRGWGANTADDGYTNSSFAPSTTASCLYNSGANTCNSTGDHKFKRTHLLSNSYEIWDFASNVSEWVDWNISNTGFDLGPTDASTGGWIEISSLDGSVTSNDLQTLGGFTSVQQVGRWNGGIGGGAIRGGGWDGGAVGGIFSLDLSNSPSSNFPGIGFRCVYRP